MFSKFFINRPIFAAVIAIVVVIAGIMSMRGLPIEEYPKLTPPQVHVSASYIGADAQTIANTVATILEDEINGVEGMIYMQSSSSSSGMMGIDVYFEVGYSAKQATIDVNNRVQAAISRLPASVQQTGVVVRERSSTILEVIAFSSDDPSMDKQELANYVLLNIADELKRVKGVGDTVVVGNQNYAMRIWMKPDLLSKFNLSVPEVINAVSTQNSQYAAGKIGEQPLQDAKNPYVYSIRSDGRYKSVKEFEDIILKANGDGSMLRLKDVADIEIGSRSYSFNGFLNNQRQVPLMVLMQNDANALETAQLVGEKLDELSATYPAGFKHTIAFDTTTFVEVSIKEVVKTFIEALLLVMVVMYLFLKSLRATIIPMLAVPVSIIGTFIGFNALGFSINLITLFALILAIGIVVDDAIIVIENVERIMRHNKNISVKHAAEQAMQEVSTPIISIVLVLSAVFIPVSFMEGFVGVIQKQFALTLVVAVWLSGFVALTLTPSLAAIFLRHNESEPFWFVTRFNDIFDWSTKVFGAGVAKILRHVLPSLLAVAIVIFAMAQLFERLPSSLVPSEDKGFIMAISSLPPASSSSRTIEENHKIAKTFLSDENVYSVMGFSGYDLIASAQRDNAMAFFIKTKPWDERTTPQSQIDAMVGKFNAALMGSKEALTFVLNVPPINGLSLTGGFDMYVQNKSGKSYNEIEQDVLKVVAAANQRPELRGVRTTLETNYPEYKFEVDYQKAMLLGVNKADIFSAMSATLGSHYINDFNMFGKTYRVYMSAKEKFRDSPGDLRDIFVKNAKGEMISLASFSTLKRSMGPDLVDRFNLFPAAKVMGDPATGYTSGDAIKAIQEVTKEVLGEQEYAISWSGTAYQEVQSTGAGKQAFIFGMVFVFLILAAQYERWLIPLAVITAVPFAVFGSLLATWARGLTNDIYFQVGLLLLIGLSAKNAILIVEFAMQEREKGKSIFEAAVSASKLRFRPIVMTSIAFTLGVFPMVISTGAGAASRHSLGTGLVGGMIAATTIAIFFVPLFYYLLENLNEKFWNKGKNITRDGEVTNA
ncbi:MAG: multidrug efflux RND transporter permease subunit [Campylobacter sp.]|nr:multidrug efflux RND transporter permease subunit [Campylobacter sp.]